jgi:small-conductance mechanosensitive channel
MSGLRRALTVASALLLGLWLALGTAAAQETPDYAAWDRLAQRAETVVDRGQASDAALESLRAEIAGWRDRFLAAQDINATRIETLRSQLDALGPPPEAGESEADDVAARRAELRARLTEARAPVVRADEAFTRANGLIAEIDALIRARQLDDLRALGPTPLNPAHWPAALADLREAVLALQRETARALTSETQLAEARNRLPATGLLLAVGLLLLARGHRWVERLGERMRGVSRRGTGVWSLLISIGHIVLPFLGFWAIVQGVLLTGLAGQDLTQLLEFLPWAVALLLAFRWLGRRLFDARDADAIVLLESGWRAEARWYATLLAFLVVLQIVAAQVVTLEELPPATEAVLQFPLIVAIGLVLLRLGQILTSYRRGSEPEAGIGFELRAIRVLGALSVAVGALAPLLAAVGYLNAALLVQPWVASLALGGLVLILQRFVQDLDHLVTGRDTASEGLFPVLAGMALTIAALPVLALLWGARTSELTDLWTRLRDGFQLGETRVSLMDFIALVVVFALGYLATRALQGGLRNSILPRTRLDKGAQTALVSGTGYIGIVLAALIAVSATGLDLSSLAIVAGALSVGIGFGLQNIVSNFVSGIILLIERPVSEGDWIEVGGNMGYVRKISVRSTRIETFDRTDVVIPNADLVSGVVTNWTRGNTIGRVIVPVGVAYGTDTRKVERILQEVAEDHPMVLLDPAPYVLFRGFGADSLDFEIRAILRDVNWVMNVHSDMNHAIARRFAEEGIEVPFAQRDVWLRNPEALSGGARPAPRAEGAAPAQRPAGVPETGEGEGDGQ